MRHWSSVTVGQNGAVLRLNSLKPCRNNHVLTFIPVFGKQVAVDLAAERGDARGSLRYALQKTFGGSGNVRTKGL
jgi:hypothetical protein